METAMQNFVDEVRPAEDAPEAAHEEIVLEAHAFREHPLFTAVRDALMGVDISDDELAYVIEETVFQLRRLASQQAVTDLDYLGDIQRHEEIECDSDGTRRRSCLVWWL